MFKRSDILFLLCSASLLLVASSHDDNSDKHHHHPHQGSCCLCDHCTPPPDEKLDVILLGDVHRTGPAPTCASLAAELELTTEDSGASSCHVARELYSVACCTAGFDTVEQQQPPAVVVTESSSSSITHPTTTQRLRSSSSVQERELFGSSSVLCADNRFAANSVEFDTPGGACSCPVCKSGAEPDAWLGASVFVPGGGSYKGSCKYINSIGLGGYLTNGFCNIFQLSLSSCCEAPSAYAWSAYMDTP